jgi:integrase
MSSGSPGSIVRSSISIYNISNILEDFSRFLKVDLALSSVSVLNHKVKLKIMLDYIRKPIDKISKDDVRRFLEYAKEKYAPNSYSCFIKTIRRFFRDYLGKTELAEFRFPTIPFTPKVFSYSKEDLQRFHNTIEHPIVKMMFHAYAVTGLRRNDLLFLMKNELLRDQRMIVKYNGSKTKHRWITFYNEELAKELHLYLDSRTDNNPRVFPVDKYKTFQRHWRLAQIKTGLAITPKDLRDWFINEMLRRGIQESYVDALVGHVPKSILSRHYVYYDPMRLKEVYDKSGISLFS